jgi:hypothetical protein
MRLRVVTLPVLLILIGVLASARRADAVREPRYANIVAACTGAPNDTARVEPPSIAMKRADHVQWRSRSPNADSFAVTPKNPDDWPFAELSFKGTRSAPAVTPEPLPTAILGHAYRYDVTVFCRNGTTQTIDPDIIIGE